MLSNFEYKNVKTGKSEEIQFLDSAASIIRYKRVFNSSMFDDFQDPSKSLEATLRAAYIMAYPDLTKEESFEQFCERFSLGDLTNLAKSVTEIISNMVPEDKKPSKKGNGKSKN